MVGLVFAHLAHFNLKSLDVKGLYRIVVLLVVNVMFPPDALIAIFLWEISAFPLG